MTKPTRFMYEPGDALPPEVYDAEKRSLSDVATSDTPGVYPLQEAYRKGWDNALMFIEYLENKE